MKNLLFAFVVILLDVMALPAGCESCQHNHDDPDEVSVPVQVVDFDKSGGSMDIQVRSNTHWIVNNNQDWLTVAPRQGNVNEVISVIAAPNTDRIGRQGEFIITAGRASTRITVRQSAGKQ